jgi:hypothetical protein
VKEAGAKVGSGDKQQFVWFYGPAVISIYQFGRDRRFLKPSIYEKVLSNGDSSLDPNFSLSFEQVNRDMETILEKDPGAFDVFWRESGLKKPMVARMSYAVTQATIKAAIQCVADTRLMDTNVVYNTTIETLRPFLSESCRGFRFTIGSIIFLSRSSCRVFRDWRRLGCCRFKR